MAYDLTLTGPTYNASGKYGQSMSGGYGQTVDATLDLTDLTLEAWVKTTSSGTIRAIAGGGGNPWIGTNTNGTARGSWGSVTSTTINGPTINDGAWHHVALCLSTTTGGVLFVDGVQAGTAVAGANVTPVAGTFGVRRFGSGTSNDWVGEVDEVAISSVVKYTGTFTPGAVSNMQANLRAVWHLDGDGLNSMGVAVADTTAPTASAAAVANSTPSTVAVTMSEAMDPAFVGGVWAIDSHPVTAAAVGGAGGTVFNLTTSAPFVNGEPARFISFTQSGGSSARDVAGNLLANFSGLAIVNNVGAVDTPPAFVSAQVTNSAPAVIVLTFNENLAASTPPASAFTPPTGHTIASVAAPSGMTIYVTVSPAIAYGETPTIGYTQPGSNPRLQDAAGMLTASFAAQSVTNNVVAGAANSYDPTKILFSPANWDMQPGFAKAINGGAYFKTIFGGPSCTLNFDLTGLLAPFPKVRYRVDKFGPWTESTLAASIVIAVPTETAGYASHYLEFVVRSTSEAVERWFTQGTAIVLTGVVLAANKSLTKPPSRPLMLVLGDSITDGVNAISNSGDATVRGDTTLGYAYQLGDLLGAEVGVVGFGGQGWNDTGGGNVPIFTATWNFIYPGVARSFAGLDAVIINHGTNDGAGNNTVSQVTNVLNGLIAAVPSTCKIIVLRPFNGFQAANIQSGIAACTNPARVNYVDTTGFYTSANSSDVVHPYGWEHISHIAPSVATAVKAILANAAVPPTLTQRTATINFGAARNLTGAMVAFYDEITPNIHGVPRYQTALETIDGSGVMTATYGSTLPSGGTGGFVIQFADKTSVNGQMVVV